MKARQAVHVEWYFDRAPAALAGTTLAEDLEMRAIPLDRLTPLLLEEVNGAIQISGYIGTPSVPCRAAASAKPVGSASQLAAVVHSEARRSC